MPEPLISDLDAPLFNACRLTPQQLQAYHDQGYLVLENVLTAAGLAAVRHECMVAWEAQKQEFDPSKNWLHNSLLVNIHHHSPIVRRYYYDGPLLDVMGQLIGPNIKGATSQLTFKMRGNTMSFGWHQDNGYGELDPYNTVTTLTALDDADEENGCLWLIPGSHRQGQIRVERSPEDRAAAKEVVVEVDDRDAIPMPIRAGNVLLFNCWMLHKSEGNRSLNRDRRILFMRYADADAVEVYNDRRPRLGPLLRGTTRFPEVRAFEAELVGRSE